MPARAASRGDRNVSGAPSTQIVAGSRAMQAEDRLEQLRAAGADEAEEPDDLAAPRPSELTSGSTRPAAMVDSSARQLRSTQRIRLRLVQSCSADRSGLHGSPERQVASDHRSHDVVRC